MHVNAYKSTGRAELWALYAHPEFVGKQGKDFEFLTLLSSFYPLQITLFGREESRKLKKLILLLSFLMLLFFYITLTAPGEWSISNVYIFISSLRLSPNPHKLSSCPVSTADYSKLRVMQPCRTDRCKNQTFLRNTPKYSNCLNFTKLVYLRFSNQGWEHINTEPKFNHHIILATWEI